MSEIFIPGQQNQRDLLGTVMQFKQLQQGQQRLGLLQQDAKRQTEELERTKKTEKMKFLMENINVFKDRESVAKNFNEIGKELGFPELAIPEDPKEMIREANAIEKYMEANPNADPAPLLKQFSSKYASLEGRQAQLDLLGKNIGTIKMKMADQYLSLLQGSGGIRPEQQNQLLETFARSGGTSELRTAALNKLMAKAKLDEEQSKSQATVGPGQTRIDVSGKPIASTPEKQEEYKPPVSYQEWNLSGRQGSYADFLKERNIKQPTAAQQTVAEYAARLEQSEPILKNLDKFISKMNLVSFTTQMNMPAAFQSSEMQQYMQAARNFINAKLRRESGAVISATEFTEARQQYLTQPRDSDKTIEQKAATRKLVYSSLRKAAGNAYQSVDELMNSESTNKLQAQDKPPTIKAIRRIQ